ncbi:MAG: DNA helicase RecQ [Nitrospirae bacterium]|nr:DNA helicase RecQ [Nitrospirota bacterium]
MKQVFGYTSFRPNQLDIITNIVSSNDVFAVMPTGGGKSLCYQLPAKLLKGTTVVISPLISLMKDQVDAAVANGLAAACLNSSLNSSEAFSVYRRMRRGELELLYIAPERFAMSSFVDTLKGISICLFAIDEAHCISEWGHDFRPDYLTLSTIKSQFPDVPIAAFTATATAKVQNDIINKLGLHDPFIIRASFNRPNLFYQVQRKIDVETQVLEFLKQHKGKSGIIYRTSRDSVDAMANFLIVNGISALPYHAGLPPETRKKNQEVFRKDEVDVIVATIAFGMGIDKSNVRFVIHADLPKNMESYYQETGRCGRDCEPAACILFYGRQDVAKIKYFINKIEDENERAIALEKMNQTLRYATYNICRRKELLRYFGEHYPQENCAACDVCTGPMEMIDATPEAQIVLSVVSQTGQRFGVGYIIDIVTGANTKRIRELNHLELTSYGEGEGRGKDYWYVIVNELLVREHLQKEDDRYPVLKLTQSGKDVLNGKKYFTMLKRLTVKESEIVQQSIQVVQYGRGVSGTEGQVDKALFEKLRRLRKKLADEQQVPAYIIFHDTTLNDMCKHLPTSIEEMRRLNGIGESKLHRYGNVFIKEINDYLVE